MKLDKNKAEMWVYDYIHNNEKLILKDILEYTNLVVYQEDGQTCRELYKYDYALESITEYIAEEYPKVSDLTDDDYDTLLGIIQDELERKYPYENIEELQRELYEENRDYRDTIESARY